MRTPSSVGARFWAIAAAIAGVALTAWSAREISLHARFYDGDVWDWQQRVLWSTAVAATFGGALAGPVMLWRSAHRATRRAAWVVTAIGLAQAPYFGCWMSANHAGFWYYWIAPRVLTLAFAYIYFSWPTGVLERGQRKPAFAVVAIDVVSLLTIFVGHDALGRPPFGWTSWGIPTIGSHTLGVTVHAIDALVDVVVSVVLLVAALRRHRRFPVAARRGAQPVTSAAIVTFGSVVFVYIAFQVAQNLFSRSGNFTVLGVGVLMINYATVGVALMLLSRLDRRLTAPVALITVDLGSDRDRSRRDGVAMPRTELVAMLGDATARVLYCRDDGTWVDEFGVAAGAGAGAGASASSSDSSRRRLAIVEAGGDGSIVAAIEFSAATRIAPVAFEAIAGRVQLDLLERRRIAEAGARLAELRALQRAVVLAQDEASIRIERDLHDGAQQRLIGLLLTAGLLARRATRPEPTMVPDAEVEALAAELAEVADAVEHAVTSARPAVLHNGLREALQLVAATTPLPVSVRGVGDLAPDDPRTVPLWLVANEAVANALKHAAATRIDIVLKVVPGETTLVVTDDGCGGVTVAPRAIGQRAASMAAALRIDSAVDHGTTITVIAPEPSELVASGAQR